MASSHKHNIEGGKAIQKMILFTNTKAVYAERQESGKTPKDNLEIITQAEAETEI